MGSNKIGEDVHLLAGKMPGELPITCPRMLDDTDHSAEDGSKATLSQILPKWLRVCKLWFQSEERWKARGYAIGTIATSLMTTGLMVQVSYAQRNFQTAMSEKDGPKFTAAVWQFVGVILAATPMFAFADYVEARLKLEWRRWLTVRLLTAYFADRAFFNLKLRDSGVDNPDARICDDIPKFADTSVFLVLSIVRKVFNCVAFAGVLWSIAPRLVYFLVGYAVVGTWLTTSVFGRQLMRLHYGMLRREGDLRFALVRVRENAESIAFYGGERRESSIASARLDTLVGVIRRKVKWEAFLSLWTNAYSYATILVPSLLTAPRYFAGEVEFGVIAQVGFAFGRIESALTLLVQQLSNVSGLAAQSERIDSLFTAFLQQSASGGTQISLRTSVTPGLVIQDLTVAAPGRSAPLTRGLNLQVAASESVLIVGPSGCGKSSLLRAIAGLWTVGCGIIRVPNSGTFFLPQQPFMPLGSLRDQLLFPSGDGGSMINGRRTVSHVSDKALLSLLNEVRLGDLAERMGGLDAVADWTHVLSTGEQQRVAWLRLLLYSPTLAFLDEATGALDAETEGALYSQLRERAGSSSCAFVSVGHRAQLIQYHSHVLVHRGNGEWQKMTAADYSRTLKTQ